MFEQNLAALQKISPQLCQTLRETPLSDMVSFFKSPDGNANITHQERALHDIDAPLAESRNLFRQEVPEAERHHKGVIVIYGVGLGYLVKRAFVESKAQIIIFEPHLDILRQTLEYVNLSDVFESGRVQLVSELNNFTQAFTATYMRGDTVKTIALPAYQTFFPAPFLALLDEVKASMYLSIVSQNTALIMMDRFADSALNNLGTFLKYPDAQIMHNQFAGIPGVVISAGPSLDRPGVMEALKAYQDKIIISCVGQAAKSLDKAGIVPDIVSAVEVKDISQQLEGVSFIEEINLVLLPQSHIKMFQFPTKRKLLAYSNQDPLTNWVSQATGDSLFGYNHIGTVSITALIHLMKMGCNPIYLIGQDLAYPEGKMYSDTSVYQQRLILNENGVQDVVWDNHQSFEGIFFKDENEYQEQKARFLNGLLTETKGWNGEKMWTTTAYDAFRKAFEFIALRHTQYQLFNCSQGGAHMDGFKEMPFAQAIAQYFETNKETDKKQRLESVFDDQYSERDFNAPAFKQVYEKLLAEYTEIHHIHALATDGLENAQEAWSCLEGDAQLTDEVKRYLENMCVADETLSPLVQSNPLINSYLKQEMFCYARDYGRKLALDEAAQEGDITEIKENLEASSFLYTGLIKGAQRLSKTMFDIITDFPISDPRALQSLPKPIKSTTIKTGKKKKMAPV